VRIVIVGTETPTFDPTRFISTNTSEHSRARVRHFKDAAKFAEAIWCPTPGAMDWHRTFHDNVIPIEFGYSERLMIPSTGIKPTHDFSAFGRCTPYRDEVLGEIAERGYSILSTLADKDLIYSPAEERNNLILRARIVLNLKQQRYWQILSTVRMAAALHTGRPVVSEYIDVPSQWRDFIAMPRNKEEKFVDVASSCLPMASSMYFSQLEGFKKLTAAHCLAEAVENAGVAKNAVVPAPAYSFAEDKTDYSAITKWVDSWYPKIADKSGAVSSIWKNNADAYLNRVIALNEPFDRKLSAVHGSDWHFYSFMNETSVLRDHAGWWLKMLSSVGQDEVAWPREYREADVIPPAAKVATPVGRQVSPDFLRRMAHMGYISACFPDLKDDAVIMEIGAGTGALARVMKLRYPRCKYVVVDIPVTLYFSAGFIKAAFPEASIFVATSADDVGRADMLNYDFVFIPAELAGELDGYTFDLVVNTHSFGEMPNEVVSKYFDIIHKSADRLFSINRFLNPVRDWRKGSNRASVSLDPHWDIRAWEFEPSVMRCPYVETPEDPCLMIAASRVREDKRDAAKNVAISNSLVASVRSQDWVRKPTPSASRITDFSSNGTLFSLWNSIRLNSSVDNCRLMIQYLDWIGRGNVEERSYYEAKIASLGG